jgi:hypothetical protein
MVQVAKSVEKAQEARWYLGFPNLPDKARELMNELLNAAEMRELDEKAMSPKADLRCSAAENPKTPVAALARLMKDKNKEVRQLAEENIRRAQLLSEVADLDKLHDLSADELRQKIQTLADRILHEAPGQRDAICAFSKTPPALLEALSKQKGVWSVAQSLAENPRTPESVLVKLAGLYRQSEYPQDVCKELCANPSSTLSVFKALISSKSASVRARAASYTELSEELVSELASDSSPDVRKALATRMDLSPQILAQLASDPLASVRVTVATRSDLEIATLLMLATDPDAAVAKAAVQREQHSAEFYRRYIDAGGRRLEPKHFSDIQEERLQELLIAEGEGFGWGGRTGFRQEIAADPRTPLNFLEVLLGDAEASVVARALTNPMIPEHLIRKTLDEKNSPAYWRAVQDNPLAPPELVVMSVNKVGSNRWAKSWYAQKMAGARLDEQLDAFLSNAMQWAADPRTPPDRLRSFAASGFWAVRFRVASNPSLPQDEALEMRTALWAEVGEALFGPAPPRLSAEVLSEDDIRGALDRLDLLPSADDKKAIAAAAKSKDALERIAAVLSPGVQPSILKMLLEDPVESIKSMAAEKLRATATNA